MTPENHRRSPHRQRRPDRGSRPHGRVSLGHNTPAAILTPMFPLLGPAAGTGVAGRRLSGGCGHDTR